MNRPSTDFPKYVIVHHGQVENEAEDCTTVGPLEPFQEQEVEEMMDSEKDNVGRRRLRQDRAKTSAEGI